MKKSLSFLLALALVFSFALPVLAAKPVPEFSVVISAADLNNATFTVTWNKIGVWRCSYLIWPYASSDGTGSSPAGRMFGMGDVYNGGKRLAAYSVELTDSYAYKHYIEEYFLDRGINFPDNYSELSIKIYARLYNKNNVEIAMVESNPFQIK